MIDYIKDNSAEENWKLSRKGMYTASAIFRLLPKDKVALFGKGAITYINEVACDAYTGYEEREGFESYDMKNGKVQESQAVAFHSRRIGLEITHYGDKNPYFQQYCPDSGGSPDGLIYTPSGNLSFGCEYKCPKRITHWTYLREIKDQWDLKRKSEEGEKMASVPKTGSLQQYYAQIQFLMAIFKCDLWHWCSYNEFFPDKHKLHIIEVRQDKPFIDNLLIRLKQAIKMKNQFIEELSSR